MYVKRIAEDNWSGNRNSAIEYECGNIEEVFTAIRNLNGRNKTEVQLLSDADRSMSISGGNEGRYITFLTIGVDDAFYNLVDLRRVAENMLDVVAGGQSGAFPAKQVLSLETVLDAARQFAQDGSMTGALTWERQK